MSRHGGGVSTALPRHGCVCRGCRARRFLPCHDLGQLVVSVGHGDPRVIPHGGFNFAVASFVIPAKRAGCADFEPEILRNSSSEVFLSRFVCFRVSKRHSGVCPSRETLSCFQRTGRHHEAAHGTGGRRNCRISRACPSCLHVPRRVASCAHLFSPFPNACPGDHALLQPAARRPQARAARACTNLAMCPAV